MPWKEVSKMSQRREFVTLAEAEGANMRALCRHFGISPTTGYRWLWRFRERNEDGLVDLPRRPYHSPFRTPAEVEGTVLTARDAHPAWGARKLRAWLLAKGHEWMPSPSTITAILTRHSRIGPAKGLPHRPWQPA